MLTRVARTDVETVIHSDSDFATVAFLRIKHADLKSKSKSPVLRVPVPQLLDSDFVKVHDAVVQSETTLNSVKTQRYADFSDISKPSVAKCLSIQSDSWVVVPNIQRNMHDNIETSVEDEVQECFSILQSLCHVLLVDIQSSLQSRSPIKILHVPVTYCEY